MKISVIIPAYNAVHTLEKAMQSVLSQTHKDVELIVMDAGSKDGTKELLERYSPQLKYWVSEPDNGTTDAMNRGYKHATGDLITFLCSDDCFYDENVFARVVQEFEKEPATEVLCCSLQMVDPRGLVEPYINPSDPSVLHIRGSLHLIGAFFRRSVFKDRVFSDDVDIANDYELFGYLTRRAKVNLRVCDLVTVKMSLGGRTNNPPADFWKARECFYVRRKYFGLWPALPLYGYEMAIAVLRNLNIRPLTWARKVRRWFRTAKSA